MLLTLNGKIYELTENNVFKEYGFPPYGALQEGKVVICKYENITRSDDIEVVYKHVASENSMRKLYNSSEEGELLNMTWHLAKELPISNETESPLKKASSLCQNGYKPPLPNNSSPKACLF